MRFQILSLLIILTFINCEDNTFTFGSSEAGNCADSVYTFTVTGAVTAVTESVTTWTPTLTAPAGATATCTMPIVGTAGANGVITCTITSAFSESAITLTKLEAEGFNDVTIADDKQAIATGKSCAGLNTFRYASKTEGSCAGNEYSFTVTGAVTKTTASPTTWTPTFSAPSDPTVTCTMPAVATDGANGVITCTITSALSNSAITLTKLVADGFNDVNLSGDSSTIATGKTCPLNTFTYGDKTEGSCADNVYTFTVTGTVTAQTTAATTWTPTLTAPADATATCTMPAVDAGGSGTITCTITSALSNSDITLTQLVSDSFNAVTIPSGNQAIATGKTCAGTTTTNPTNPSNPSNDGSKFISLNAILFSFFLLIF